MYFKAQLELSILVLTLVSFEIANNLQTLKDNRWSTTWKDIAIATFSAQVFFMIYVTVFVLYGIILIAGELDVRHERRGRNSTTTI